ncbi:hypothetical protein ACXIZN_24965 [Amycolatopsis sp. TRM77291]
MGENAWLPEYAGMNSLADCESLHDQVDQGFIEILAQGCLTELLGIDAFGIERCQRSESLAPTLPR